MIESIRRNTMNRGVFVLSLLLLITSCGQSGTMQEANKDVVVPPGMVLIPAGDFIMGSDDIDASGKSEEFGFNEPWFLPEHPKRVINLKSYLIDRTEVNNGQFKAWLKATGRFDSAQLANLVNRLQLQKDELPVRIVTWKKAQEFCEGVGKRLPTEMEWEKAARGSDGREYPWGNDWDPELSNVGQNEQDLMPVGSYEKGKSVYGVYDMAGNVMEWTADWYEAYPGAKYQSPNYGKKRRVARGGSWGGIGHYVIPHYFRTAYRFNFPPEGAYNDVGFRCAMDLPK